MKVLLAIDGSVASTQAAKFIGSLAKKNPVDMTVLTVSYASADYSLQPWFPEWAAHENSRAESLLADAKKELETACRSVKTVHASGAAVPAILNESKESGADLIVLGATGHSAISRALLGSVSDTVASRAECSVLIVRPPTSDAGDCDSPDCESLVLGYDKSIASREAAAELMEWNFSRDTRVEVVCIVQSPFVYVGEGYVADPITVRPEQIADASETAERMACQIAEHFPHTNSHTHVSDHIGNAIVQTAEKESADLIVVGDAGHTMLGELLLGSTSKYVLRHAHCSVWISRHHYNTANKLS